MARTGSRKTVVIGVGTVRDCRGRRETRAEEKLLGNDKSPFAASVSQPVKWSW